MSVSHVRLLKNGQNKILHGQCLNRRYCLNEAIAYGAASIIYRGVDTLLNRNVAVKILQLDAGFDVGYVKRFQNEARLLYRLNHPAVIKFYDYLEEPNYYAIVMEYLAGGDLDEFLFNRHGPLSLQEIHTIMQPILSAVGYIHQRGIIHRDIKPANILIGNTSRLDLIRLIDFGVSSDINSIAYSRPDDTISGTILFMSPEQYQNPRTVDQRSDVYSLGVMLYQMATGVMPFYSHSFNEILRAHLEDTPVLPRLLNPWIDKSLEQIILKALQKSPAHRFQSISEMKQELDNIENHATPWASASMSLTTQKRLHLYQQGIIPSSSYVFTTPTIVKRRLTMIFGNFTKMAA